MVGDAAYLIDARSGLQVPGVSQGALQMGRYVARVIHEELAGSHQSRDAGFHYKDWGSMATIGKSRAVVELGRLRFGGFLAWLAWLLLHVTVLIGFRNRVAVFLSWIYSYLLSRRGSRLITSFHPDYIEHTRSAAIHGAAVAGSDTAPGTAAESRSQRN